MFYRSWEFLMSDLFPFTASNGVVIREAREREISDFWGKPLLWTTDGRDWRPVGAGELSSSPGFTRDSKMWSALSELAWAERDASLGRWRSKEHPDYVVYVIDSRVRVLEESTGMSYGFDRATAEFPDYCRAGYDTHAERRFQRVARAYFGAHPEPKPWHNAKPGEAWLITIDGYAHEWAAVVEESGLFRTKDGQGWTRDHEQITAARPLWPEGGDES